MSEWICWGITTFAMVGIGVGICMLATGRRKRMLKDRARMDAERREAAGLYFCWMCGREFDKARATIQTVEGVEERHKCPHCGTIVFTKHFPREPHVHVRGNRI